MNANMIKTQIFHDVKFDLKGNLGSHEVTLKIFVKRFCDLFYYVNLDLRSYGQLMDLFHKFLALFHLYDCTILFTIKIMQYAYLRYNVYWLCCLLVCFIYVFIYFIQKYIGIILPYILIKKIILQLIRTGLLKIVLHLRQHKKFLLKHLSRIWNGYWKKKY